MKKKMKWLAALAAFAFTFAACGNGSGNDTPATAETTVTNPDDTTEEQIGTDGENNGSTETGGNGTTTSDPTTDPADSANQSDDDDTDTTGSGENTGDTSDTPIIYIGTKAPDEAKAVGDIVFSDGSATPYASGLELTAEQQAAAIAVIFYVGTELNSDDAEGNADTTTSRTLGVGLAHDRNGLAWCTNTANAYSKNITTIQCTPSGSTGTYTFTGDKDGSDNLTQISAFLSETDSEMTDDTATAANYPAFYFAKNYKSQDGSHVAGTDYADDWYLPTIAELFQIWKSKATVDAASALCGGSQFDTDVYWSSSQYASPDNTAYRLDFKYGNWGYTVKHFPLPYVCAVRAFN